MTSVNTAPAIVGQLRGMRPWLKITGWAMVAFTLITLAQAIMTASGMAAVAAGGSLGLMQAGISVVAALFCGYFAWLMLRTASAIEVAVASNASADVERALELQRKFWKLVGVLTLIAIVVSVIGIALAIAIPLMNELG